MPPNPSPTLLRRKAMTLREFAVRCGVSKSTASLAFQPVESCPLAPRTRQTILDTAQELGYRPNWRGQALAKQRTGAIGLIYLGSSPFMSNYHGHLVKELIDRLSNDGYDLMHIKVDPDGEQLHRKLMERRVDGCFCVAYEAELIRLVDASNVPTVLINGGEAAQAPCVQLDDQRAAVEAVAYLVRHGHRRITFYNDPLRAVQHYSVEERIAGYRQAMRDAGLSAWAQTVVAEADEFAGRLARQDARSRPTAILGYDDTRALDLMLQLWRRGLTAPRDFSVVGFNDETYSKRAVPPLTTMAFPVRAVADAAGSLMLAQLDGRPLPPEALKRIPLELVERESVAPPASDDSGPDT